VLDYGHALSGTQDDGASVSVFHSDPDGNGLELYYDRPRDRWTDERGQAVLREATKVRPPGVVGRVGVGLVHPNFSELRHGEVRSPTVVRL
jgi:catechol-2,3-dioxygenase